MIAKLALRLANILSVLVLIVNNNPSDVPFDQNLAPLHNIERLCVQGVNNHTSIFEEFKNHVTRPDIPTVLELGNTNFIVRKPTSMLQTQKSTPSNQVDLTGAERQFLKEVGNKTSVFKILLDSCEQYKDYIMTGIHEKYGNYRHICQREDNKAVYLFANYWFRLEPLTTKPSGPRRRPTSKTKAIQKIAGCVEKCKITTAQGKECNECSTCLKIIPALVEIPRRIPISTIFEVLGYVVGSTALTISIYKGWRHYYEIKEYISELRLPTWCRRKRRSRDPSDNSIPLEVLPRRRYSNDIPLEDLGGRKDITAIQIEDLVESEGDDEEGRDVMLFQWRQARPTMYCSVDVLCSDDDD